MNVIEFVKEQMRLEADAITKAIENINESVIKAIDLLYDCKGKVVVTGMGKTGIIARKIAATLASTGTTSIYLHPAEGVHGDLGMIQDNDVVIAISNTGNTQEILAIIPYLKFNNIPLIALTGNMQSVLATNSEVAINCSAPKEYEPFGLVPTASTTVALSIGDALAVALLKRRDFKVSDFAMFHPGGTIGKKLLLKVGDIMHKGDNNPIVGNRVTMQEVILEMTSKGLGCTNVVDNGKLIGIVTDGDLRRFLQTGDIDIHKNVTEVMTRNPKSIKSDMLAVEAINIMEAFKITMLPVVDDEDKPVGLLHMHDLIKSGVIT